MRENKSKEENLKEFQELIKVSQENFLKELFDKGYSKLINEKEISNELVAYMEYTLSKD